MKKILFLLFVLFFGCTSYALENIEQPEDITTLNNSDRLTYIRNVKNVIFAKDCAFKLESPEFKKLIKDYKKDKNYPENYYAAQAGYTYFRNNNISALFTPKMDVMYQYSIQEPDNMRIVYYYTMLGNLKYIEFLYGSYPNYPYYVRKYCRSGKLITTTYIPDKTTEIKFNKDGSNAMITCKGKVINNLLVP